MSVENPNELPVGYRGKPVAYGPHAPMTLSQASYLMTLCEEANEVLDDSLSQAEAAELIHELEMVTGRAVPTSRYREQ